MHGESFVCCWMQYAVVSTCSKGLSLHLLSVGIMHLPARLRSESQIFTSRTYLQNNHNAVRIAASPKHFSS